MATVVWVTSIGSGGDVGLRGEGRRWVLVADGDKGSATPRLNAASLNCFQNRAENSGVQERAIRRAFEKTLSDLIPTSSYVSLQKH